MEANKTYAKVERIRLNGYNRIIVISDIHGSAHLLKRLLHDVAFSDDDALLLLGDLIEKGESSLEAIRLIMSLCAKQNAFALMGNCDTVWDDLRNHLYSADILGYMRWRKVSIFSDMCDEMGFDAYSEGSEKTEDFILANYSDVLGFLHNLPQIIESEDYIFAHAGIDVEDNLEINEFDATQRREVFLLENNSFNKTVIVGHMPSMNYCDITNNKLSNMPVFDFSHNKISIDGGNTVKNFGQLNALIIEDGKYNSMFVDDLVKITAIKAQSESEAPFSISWYSRHVEVLNENGDMMHCKHVASSKTFDVPASYVYEYRDEKCCNDFTTYYPKLNVGDEVALLSCEGARCLIKINGIIGWAGMDCFAWD